MKIKMVHIYINIRLFLYQFVRYQEFCRFFSQFSNFGPLEMCENKVAPSIVWLVEGREVWWPKNWTFSCYDLSLYSQFFVTSNHSQKGKCQIPFSIKLRDSGKKKRIELLSLRKGELQAQLRVLPSHSHATGTSCPGGCSALILACKVHKRALNLAIHLLFHATGTHDQ